MSGVDVKVELLIRGIGPMRTDEVYVTDAQHAAVVAQNAKEILASAGHFPHDGEDAVVILSAEVPPKPWQPKKVA